MGVFDRALRKAQNIGGNIAASAGVAIQDNTELNNLKMQLAELEKELESAYAQVGRRCIDQLVKVGDLENVDLTDLLKILEPKLERKQELEQKLVELEKRMKQNAILREKARAEQEFLDEKIKLDRALAMEVLSQEEYDAKIHVARRRVDNFEEIRRVEQQFNMNIITREERDAKINELTQ